MLKARILPWNAGFSVLQIFEILLSHYIDILDYIS